MTQENTPPPDEEGQTLPTDIDATMMSMHGGSSEAPAGAGGPHELAGYQLTRLLGRGGMGEVWEAQQERPRRRVAIKLVRGDLLSAAMRRRFEIESEALGRLSHEGIAKVFEAGLDDATGRPYYAMEYVDGETLGSFIQRSAPSVNQRLGLLVKLCRAVQHAHQKGVIHRDLKPSNIMVTPDGEPKILDFGLARLAGDGDEASLVTRETQAGQVLGTLAYMSPEQAGGQTESIDALTDVYALGVIAYELLTGQMPLNLSDLPLPVAVRRILEDEPSRLSSIDRGLRGDMDTIVAKAMAKDRAMRYASAEALAEDLRRFLESEPITARRPSTWYNARKFARRNKAVVAGVATSFIILLAGAATSFVFALQAREQAAEARLQADRASLAEQEAVAQREEADRQREEAVRQSAVAEETNEFLLGIFYQADPGIALGREITAVELVSRGAEGLSGRFDDQPLVKATLQNHLAMVLMELGRPGEAEPLFRSAWQTREGLLGKEHKDTLVSFNNLATAIETLGEVSKAEPMHRKILASREKELGPDHLDTLLSANNLAAALQMLGRADEAEPLFRRVLKGYEEQLGTDDSRTLSAMGHLGEVLEATGRADEAEPLFRRSMDGHVRVHGDDHPYTLKAVNNMAFVLHTLGRIEEATALHEEVLKKRERVLGPDHPDTLSSVHNLGAVFYESQQHELAEKHFRRVLKARERLLGPEHPDTLSSVNSVAVALMSLGEYAEAEPLLRRSLEGDGRVMGAEHPQTLSSMNNMAGLLSMLGRPRDAAKMYRETLEARERVLGEHHISTLQSLYGLATVLNESDRTDEARPLLLRALNSAAANPALGPEHPATLRFARAYVRCVESLGLDEEAKKVREYFGIK